MANSLKEFIEKLFDQTQINLSHFQSETESKEYEACHFYLNGSKIISRQAKITPKKIGQFVTCWKRNKNNSIEPFQDKDKIDFFIIYVKSDTRNGIFIFPQSILITKGIITSPHKDGKRGFRVYPLWDVVKNKQAEKTQQWQLHHFYEIDNRKDIQKLKTLFQ